MMQHYATGRLRTTMTRGTQGSCVGFGPFVDRNRRRSMRRTLAPLLLLLLGLQPCAAEPWRADPNNTRGWALMTPKERIAHQARIREFRDIAQCRAYQAEHHSLMEERAREHGRSLEATGRDFCAHIDATARAP